MCTHTTPARVYLSLSRFSTIIVSPCGIRERARFVPSHTLPFYLFSRARRVMSTVPRTLTRRHKDYANAPSSAAFPCTYDNPTNFSHFSTHFFIYFQTSYCRRSVKTIHTHTHIDTISPADVPFLRLNYEKKKKNVRDSLFNSNNVSSVLITI